MTLVAILFERATAPASISSPIGSSFIHRVYLMKVMNHDFTSKLSIDVLTLVFESHCALALPKSVCSFSFTCIIHSKRLETLEIVYKKKHKIRSFDKRTDLSGSSRGAGGFGNENVDSDKDSISGSGSAVPLYSV